MHKCLLQCQDSISRIFTARESIVTRWTKPCKWHRLALVACWITLLWKRQSTVDMERHIEFSSEQNMIILGFNSLRSLSYLNRVTKTRSHSSTVNFNSPITKKAGAMLLFIWIYTADAILKSQERWRFMFCFSKFW